MTYVTVNNDKRCDQWALEVKLVEFMDPKLRLASDVVYTISL
jgi:hypothetical protein